MRPTAKRIGAGLLAAAATTVLLLGLPSTPAIADDPPPITLTPATQTVEYGQSWEVTGKISPQTYIDSWYTGLKVATDGVIIPLDGTGVYNGGFAFGDFDPGLRLGIGSHSVVAAFPPGTSATTSTTAVVTINPAPILATTTITADPNNSNNAIITSQLSGKYVEQLPNCQCEGQNGYLMPAGSWTLTVTDSNGKTVLTKQFDQAANGLPTFVNYWPSVPTGETFSAQTVFTVVGGGKNDFTLTSQKFSWTSKKGAGEQGPGSPSSTPKPVTVKSAAFAPPLAVLWGALLVIVILIALDVILLVNNRRSRGPRPTQGKDVES